MQQRYYDPIAGRFLSVDPVVTDANTGKGFGLYTYVENNPYSKIDPDGRKERLVLPPQENNPTKNPMVQAAGVGLASLAAVIVGKVTDNPGLVQAGIDGAEALKLNTGEGLMMAASLALGGRSAEAPAGTIPVNGEGLIYRAASGTPASMTPRAVDAKGLSAADSLANALPGKNQVIDTSKLKNLCAVCDNPKTGHVSITPKDMSQMQGWINSRGGAEMHPLTRELMDAVVGTEKK